MTTVSRTYHVDDVVALKDESMDAVGYVDRTHGDVETHEPHPDGTYGMKIHRSKSLSRVAFKQFMKDGVPPKGFVLVQWQTHPKTELVAEKDLELLDRTFTAGDIVRRDGQGDNAMAGTVVTVRRQCSLLGICEVKEPRSGKILRAAWLPTPMEDEPQLLEQVQSGQVLYNIPASELQFVHQYNEGDIVIYRDWIGRLRECFDEVTVRLPDNGVVTLQNESELEPLNGDPGERFSVGSLVKTKKGCLRTGIWRYGAYNPNTVPVGVVVEVRTQECQVDWLRVKITEPVSGSAWPSAASRPPAMLTQDEIDSGDFYIYDEQRRPSDDSPLSTKVMSDLDIQGGLRVKFKDAAGAAVKYDGTTPHGKFERVDRRESLGYDMNVFTVTNTLTEVDVQWADLSITTETAAALVPDSATDDEDAVFPGEIVCTNEHTFDGPDGTVRPKKVGVVQDVNNGERIARVRWCAPSQLAFLETTYTTPIPTSLWKGNPAEAAEEVSFYDIKAPDSINRRRGDFVLVHNVNLEVLGVTAGAGSIDWFGEIVDIRPDGICVIRLGAAQPVMEIAMPTESTILAIRRTEIDDMGAGGSEGEFEDGMSISSDISGDLDGLDDYDMEDDDDEGQWFVAGQPGMAVDSEDDSWSTASEDDAEDHRPEDMETDAEDPPVSVPQLEPLAEARAVAGVAVLAAAAAQDTTNAVPPRPTPSSSTVTTIEEMHLSSYPAAPPAYDILDTPVPTSHPFAHNATASSSAHMKAVQKEHKILRLASNLPSGIFVRTWESRLDLIRVLFIGPVGTPYEYAPFVVDLFLGPGFPSEAPAAHFHSWTSEGSGMQGRVNPNLYEEGKICLSLLGTWHGDESKDEGWVQGKSTILQILVSILGLVLVKEPYYNEAGYEPLQGLSSSRHSSAVYTERTYLRARAFLISPLGPLLQSTSRPRLTSPTQSPQEPIGASVELAAAVAPPGVEGFQDVLTWLYLAPTGPDLLTKAISAAKNILTSSEDGGVERDGLRAVSRGAGLLLKRVLTKLEELAEERERAMRDA